MRAALHRQPERVQLGLLGKVINCLCALSQARTMWSRSLPLARGFAGSSGLLGKVINCLCALSQARTMWSRSLPLARGFAVVHRHGSRP